MGLNCMDLDPIDGKNKKHVKETIDSLYKHTIQCFSPRFKAK